MKTKNQIRKIFSDFASNHLQIHQFGYGEEFEQQAVEGINYPLLWVVALPSPLNGVDYDRTYRIILADRVRKDESDEIEVESDTELLLLDTISYIWKYGQQNQMDLQDGITTNPFWEKWSDEVTGHYADITIRDYFDYNSCALPISGQIPSDEFNCASATITINGQTFSTAASGGLLNILVKDTDGDSVGSKIGSEWVVPAASGGATTEEEMIEMSFIYGQGISI